MAWTPPTKFIVFLSFLLMAFGVFIILDQSLILWSPSLLPIIHLADFNSFESWILIAAIVVFLSWFVFFLGVWFKGL